jgi:hypothetical protein
VFLKDAANKELSAVQYLCYGVWVKAVTWLAAVILVISSTVALILPSFFTLLIVRTSTVEKESTNFGGVCFVFHSNDCIFHRVS